MKKLLIVEDEFILQMMIEKMVERIGHQIVGKAKSGDMAIDLVKQEAPDVVLMDIKIIGKYDGIETVRKIREFSDVPVLYLTGNTDPQIMKQAMDTQPMAFITKPFEYKELKTAIEKAIGASNA